MLKNTLYFEVMGVCLKRIEASKREPKLMERRKMRQSLSAGVQNGIHVVLHVVHHHPLGGTGLAHPRLPASQPIEV